MREETLKAALVAAIKKAVTVRPSDVVAALKRARSQLDAILRNIEIARRILSEEELRREAAKKIRYAQEETKILMHAGYITPPPNEIQ